MGHAWQILIKEIPLFHNNLVIFQTISIKLEMRVDNKIDLSLSKCQFTWVTMGHAWLILMGIVYSDNNFVISRPISMKLEM